MADGKAPLMQGEETAPTAPPPAYNDVVFPTTTNMPQAQPQNQYGGQYAQPGSTPYYGTIPQGPATVLLSAPAACRAFPVNMQCPNCGQQIITKLTYVTGLATWLACMVICFFGGIFGCCFIPFCLDSLKDVRHSCPICEAYLCTYHRMQ